MFKNILITQSQMKNYSGSEIVTLELAEYFSEVGSRVTILTNYVDHPIKGDLNSIANLSVIKVGSEEANRLDVKNFDLIWIHHLTMNDPLINQLYDEKKREGVKVVFHHMSSTEPLEFPTVLQSEKELADIVMFNSLETKEILESRGADFSDSNETMILGNPAPLRFLNKKMIKKDSIKKAQTIGVVSNHPPDEMREAAQLLARDGIQVDFIGRTGGKYERVTPELLDRYDIIVSIGKTVQYCIVNNKPVYCYDRFGGPGFLVDENYTLAMNLNFSGRGFDYKTAAEIATELSNQFDNITRNSNTIHDRYAEDFLLPNKIQLLYKNLKDSKRVIKQTAVGKNSLIYYAANINKYFPAYLEYQYKYKDINKNLDRVNDLNRKLDARNRQLEAIISSRSYKLFRLLWTPVRLIKKTFRYGWELLSKIRRSYILFNTPNIQTVAVGGLLYRLYGVRKRYSGLRVAVIARGVHTRPTSSAWIRLFSPLTYKKTKHRISFYSSTDEMDLKNVDICIIQRTAIDSTKDADAFIAKARRYGTRVIVDVDDSFTDLDKAHPQYEEQKRWVKALEKVVENADELWVSTPKITERFKRSANILPNSVDDRIWHIKSNNILSGEKIRLLYMGTGTHHEDFKMILPDLDKLNAKYNNIIELTLIGVGSGLPEREWLIKKPIPERNTIYPLFVKWLLRQDGYDVGIAPLINSEFNRAKSDIKVLDYLCCGLIPLVSDIEPYKNPSLDDFVIRVGYTKDAWFNALEDIILHKERYKSQKEDKIQRIRQYILKDRSTAVIHRKIEEELSRGVATSKHNPVKSV